jgi:hypothetical protein
MYVALFVLNNVKQCNVNTENRKGSIMLVTGSGKILYALLEEGGSVPYMLMMHLLLASSWRPLLLGRFSKTLNK